MKLSSTGAWMLAATKATTSMPRRRSTSNLAPFYVHFITIDRIYVATVKGERGTNPPATITTAIAATRSSE